jgi:hypothetical protein
VFPLAGFDLTTHSSHLLGGWNHTTPPGIVQKNFRAKILNNSFCHFVKRFFFFFGPPARRLGLVIGPSPSVPRLASATHKITAQKNQFEFFQVFRSRQNGEGAEDRRREIPSGDEPNRPN